MQGGGGAEFPRFSDAEFERRHDALRSMIEEASVDHLLVYGAERAGSGVAWTTGWPVTREAVVVVSPGRQDVLLVQHYNHLPAARRIATDADVRWGGADSIDSALEVVSAYEDGSGRMGVIGPLGHRGYEKVASFAEGVVDLSNAYTRLRLVKSAEEIDWTREGARLTDLSIAALLERATPGHSEHDLLALIEGAYVPHGGSTHIHYLALTSMSHPDRCVPSQYAGGRRARSGDVLTVELSAAHWGYAGQILRTFIVDAEPTSLFQELHDVAQAAFDEVCRAIRPGVAVEDAVAAARSIENAGFTTYDDLIHGFGGGYLPPIAGSPSRTLLPIPDMKFEAGMTIVVQPNVITTDERAGVQTGELVLVTDGGVTRLHSAPDGLLSITGAS